MKLLLARSFRDFMPRRPALVLETRAMRTARLRALEAAGRVVTACDRLQRGDLGQRRDHSEYAHVVRNVGHDEGWSVLGGAVDVGESPAAAAVREAREEISADVQLVRLVNVLGGPDYEVSYPNGDRTAYVTAV